MPIDRVEKSARSDFKVHGGKAMRRIARFLSEQWRMLLLGSLCAISVLALAGCGADGYVSEADIAEQERKAEVATDRAVAVAGRETAELERLRGVRRQQQEQINQAMELGVFVAGMFPGAAAVGLPGILVAGNQIRKSKFKGIAAVVNAMEAGKGHDPAFAEGFKGGAGQAIEDSLKAQGVYEDVQKARSV